MDSFYANFIEDVKNIIPEGHFVFEEREQMTQEQTIEVRKENIVQLMQLLQSKHGFNFMMDICGVHWPEREKQFDVVYHLLNSAEKNVFA